MQIINRKNAVIILCCVYTIISLINTIAEVFFDIRIEDGAMNNLVILGVASIAIIILALQRWLRNWNIWFVIVFQYVVFIGSVMLLLWILSHIEPLHPDGYHDMFLSCSFFYGIGAVIYYITFFGGIHRQNKMLEKVQDEK